MIILKIILVPVMLVLGLLRAVLSFFHSAAKWVCWVLSVICLICGLYSYFIDHAAMEGIWELVSAFALSPYGLPAVAGWIIVGLAELNCALRGFVFG